MKRFLLTIPAFVICFVGGMSFAPAAKDSKARLKVVSQWAPSGDAGYEDWKKEARGRLAKRDENKKAQELANKSRDEGKEMGRLQKVLEDFNKELQKQAEQKKEHKTIVENPDYTAVMNSMNELKKLKQAFVDEPNKSFAERREGYETYLKKSILHATLLKEKERGLIELAKTGGGQ